MRRATSAAAAPPNRSSIGGAGTGVGWPLELPWLLDPWLLEPWLLEPQLLEPCPPLLLLDELLLDEELELDEVLPVEPLDVLELEPVLELDPVLELEPVLEWPLPPELELELEPELELELELEPLEVDEMTTPLLPPPPHEPPPAKKPPPKPPDEPPMMAGTAVLPSRGASYGAGADTTVTAAGAHVVVVLVTARRTLRGATCFFGRTRCFDATCIRGFSTTWTAPPPITAPPHAQAHSFAKAIRTDIAEYSFVARRLLPRPQCRRRSRLNLSNDNAEEMIVRKSVNQFYPPVTFFCGAEHKRRSVNVPFGCNHYCDPQGI